MLAFFHFIYFYSFVLKQTAFFKFFLQLRFHLWLLSTFWSGNLVVLRSWSAMASLLEARGGASCNWNISRSYRCRRARNNINRTSAHVSPLGAAERARKTVPSAASLAPVSGGEKGKGCTNLSECFSQVNKTGAAPAALPRPAPDLVV